MNPEELIQNLKEYEEIIPNEHNKSYELIKTIIDFYSKLTNLEKCNYNDLNLIYLMTVETARSGIPSKLQLVRNSNLTDLNKNDLTQLLNNFSANNSNIPLGMFGTGFHTFMTKTSDEFVKSFIKACIEIKDLNDDEEIFSILSEVLNTSNCGMRATSASYVLHCLKPYIFPIIYKKDMYEDLGIRLKDRLNLNTYIENCRIIRDFRNEHFDFKNYRIFDLESFKIHKTDIDYLKILEYLSEFKGKKYQNPDRGTLSNTESEQYTKIKEKGSAAVKELSKMVILCCKEFKLTQHSTLKWLDGSNTKVRDYLWAQLKYQTKNNIPISISLFAEMSETNNKPRFRFSLEIKNDEANNYLKDYHRFLDMPIDASSSLVYVTGSNEIKKIKTLEEPPTTIKEKLNNGIYEKVQLSRIVEWTEDLTNDMCEKLMLESVEELIPYYEHVIKLDNTTNTITSPMNASNSNRSNLMIDKNIILYGPPGTGKTYNSATYAVALCDNKSITELHDYNEVMSRFNILKEEQRIYFTTFHQSYGYEEFIEGIKPVLNNSQESGTKENLLYKIEPGIFKKFCKKALANPESTYVFIIDEINRANISKVFGELITLIEPTKRYGMTEAATAILPYSGEEFSVPKNLYIIGTMNTADRSIALMDTALRRRFSFIEMQPQPEILNNINAGKVDELDIVKMLNTINQRIEFLYDREHTIGHAFFTSLKDDPSIVKLSSIFEKSVIPLLQEYFFEDYQKIQMVLGDNAKTNPQYKFIVEKDLSPQEVFKGQVNDAIDLPEKQYTINKSALLNLQSYVEII